MLRIILVHGELRLGETLARQMESLGHSVARVATARAAAALIEDAIFDLAVVERGSLSTDGAGDVGCILRADPSIRVLILTSERPRVSRHKRDSAADRSISPFTRDELCAKLDATMMSHPTSLPRRR